MMLAIGTAGCAQPQYKGEMELAAAYTWHTLRAATDSCALCGEHTVACGKADVIAELPPLVRTVHCRYAGGTTALRSSVSGPLDCAHVCAGDLAVQSCTERDQPTPHPREVLVCRHHMPA